VAVFAVASGVTSGSGRVAVAGEDGGWQCGHFDRWQVGNPFSEVWQWPAVAVFAVAVA
jgi:hypothetical protein